MGALSMIVLGSAAGGAVPQWNCRCPACLAAWDDPAKRRTQASLAVSANGDDWVLVNASPDVTTQILATKALQPRRGARGSPIRAVVLTGTEIDQVAGLLSLRERHAFAIYAVVRDLQILAENRIFEGLSREEVERRPVSDSGHFSPVPDLEMRLFPVPGKIPLFLEDAVLTRSESFADIGYGLEITSGAARAIYLPCVAHIDEELNREVRKADVVFFDGTCFDDNDLIAAGAGQKTSRRMGHIPVNGGRGSLAGLKGITCRKIYTHINNTNPVLLDGSPQQRCVREQGWEIAYDGMVVEL